MATRVGYAVTNSWSSGQQASLSLTPDQALNGWTLEFDAAYDITQIWNAQIVSHVGNHYVIRNLDWNASVPAGSSVSFGFIASPGTAPAGYVLNGEPVGTTAPPPAVELPAASVADVAITEGHSGQAELVFQVTLSKASAVPVTLAYATQAGTATAGSDFLAASGTVTFAPGETSKAIAVQVIGDTLFEPIESFTLVLSSAVGATLAKATGLATIRNDDPALVTPPAATIADVSLTEGDSGQKLATFVVALSKAAAGPVTIGYATQDGTAVAGSDYLATSGTLAFAAGETSKSVTVSILGDTTVEGDEAFRLALSSPVGATLTQSGAAATIRNDDVATAPPPSMGGTVTYAVPNDWGNGFVADVRVSATTVGLNGWTVAFEAGFNITNTWGAEIVSHVGTQYVLRNAAYNGTVLPSQTVSFGFQAASTGGHDISQLTLNGADVGTPQPPVTPPPAALPTISIADASVTEGNLGSIDAVFAVTLSEAAATTVTVRFDTGNGTALAGSDFTAATGTLTFAPGEASKSVRVAALGDTTPEATETYAVILSAPSGATIADGTARGTILDTDTAGPTPPATPQPGYFHTEGNQILNEAGEPVKIAGVNWFGMETTDFTPYGLHTRSYTDMMDQMKELGFNTIRLPFSDQLLDPGRNTPNGINYNLNPDLQGLSGLALMDKIVDYAGSIGLKIILDHHRSSAGNGPNGNGLWYDSTYGDAEWIENWKMLGAHYAGNTTVIGADLANEPHAATWGGGGSNDWEAAATRAGNAIQSVNPNLLIIVEGVGGNYWWGGNLTGVAGNPVTLDVPNRVVYSPHDYPNSIYGQPWFQDANFPNNLEAIFDQYWGYIYRQDIAPVLLGEFGSRLTDPKDVAWMERIVPYLAGDFNADGQSDIPADEEGMSWTWWSWNPNSGDTGGILADDWRTVNQAKLDALQPIMADGSPLTGGL
jgi:chitinase